MNKRGLPGMFAPTYHEFAGEEREVRDFGDVLSPLLLGLRRRFDAIDAGLPQVREALREPVDVLFDRDDHVAEHRRAAWSRDGEQVREASDHEPEVGAWSVGPPVAKRDAVVAPDVDAEQGAGHCVETCGEDDRVELVVAVGRADAGGGELDDGGLLQVDEGDIRPVVGLEVVDVDAQALRAEGVVGRGERRRDLRVVHGRADLLAHELGGNLVRLLVEEEVDETAEKGDATRLPAPLELRGPLFGRCVEEQLWVEHVGAAEARRAGELTELGEVRVTPLLALVIDRTVVRGDAEVRCALEHGELRGLFGDLRYRLDRRRTGADDPDSHAREVDALVGPLTRVVRRALEDLSAVEARPLRGREAAGCHHAERGRGRHRLGRS